MTENLLQKLEEKMMVLLSEIEDSRQEIKKLKEENGMLRIEVEQRAIQKSSHEKKLQDILSLLESVATDTNAAATKLTVVENAVGQSM
jgi:regulator of replication initiation timing